MAEDDVPDVLRAEAERGDLVQRGLREVEDGLGPAEEVRAEALLGPRHVLRTDAALDEDEPVPVGLHEKTVADRGKAPSSVSIVRMEPQFR